jgi:hypothetical protein
MRRNQNVSLLVHSPTSLMIVGDMKNSKTNFIITSNYLELIHWDCEKPIPAHLPLQPPKLHQKERNSHRPPDAARIHR